MQPITSHPSARPRRQFSPIAPIGPRLPTRHAGNLLSEFCSKTPLLLRRWIVLIAATVVFACGAAAQTPDRAITIVVPTTAGTGPDILARTVGEELQRRWSQPVIVENKTGASNNIGTQFVARAAPDGHTLLMAANPFTATIHLFKNVPYDPVKNFTPIIEVATGSLALAVHPSVPANSVKQFIEHVKARPGQLHYSSPGVGVPHHLAMELFKLVAKVDMKHVPYRGTAGATQDLVGGHVSAGFQAVHVGLPFAQNKQLRFLAIASKDRIRVAPQVPTLIEEGLPVEVDFWYGLFAPAGTSRAIVERYNNEINDIIRMPKVFEKLDKQGVAVVGGTPEHLGEFIARDIVKWQNVIREAGITAE
jgi:tripartite-type tricarboxylate transporter receptor subunit TctC